MDKKLEQELFEKYPELFENRHKSMQETCMVWGLELGTGWYDIVNNVCFQITQHEKNVTNEKSPRHNKDYQPVRFEQTKEKFGGLRIYYDGGDDYVQGIVNMAEAMSYCVCEECGDKGKPNKGGWISTLCENCRAKTEK